LTCFSTIGSGSGHHFLRSLETLQLIDKPIIAINTILYLSEAHDFLYKEVDFVFYKGKKDYSPKNVIDDILYVGFKNKTHLAEKVATIQNNALPKMISAELDDIGISHRLKGRDYLYRAILYSIQKNNTLDTSYIRYVADCYDISTTGVLNAMQTAIIKAWNNNSIDNLRKKYTAQINYETGVPTPAEFVGYYVRRITTALGIL